MPFRGSAFAVVLFMGALWRPAQGQQAWQVYEYDSLGNLVRSWDSTGRDAAFAYDTADNRSTAAVSSASPPPVPTPPVPPAVTRYRVIHSPTGTAVFPERQP